MAALSAAIGLAILLYVLTNLGPFNHSLLMIFSFLPETLRAIVNTGEIRPPVHLRPLIPVLAKYGPKGVFVSPQSAGTGS